MPHDVAPPSDDQVRSASSALDDILRTLLPAEPALPSVERASVERDVVRTVEAQLAAMSTALRLGVHGGLLAFRLLPLLRWGRPFGALDDERRRSWIRTWAEDGIGPMPALLKLLRSCTLFAWFDHPRVAAALASAATD